MKIRTTSIKAADEPMEEEVLEEGTVEIDPDATDLLFEAEDVAELIAEVTGEAVEVTASGEEVVFAIGDDEFTVTPEGDEEMLEASTRVLRGKGEVKASKGYRRPATKNVKASTKPGARTIRKIPRGQK